MQKNKLFGLILVIVVGLCSSAYSQGAQLDSGINWLNSNQNPTGSWGNTTTSSTTAYFSTSAVLQTLKVLGQDNTPQYQNGIQWAGSEAVNHTAYLASKISALSATGIDLSADISILLSYRNSDGSWGGYLNYRSTNFHIALALQALKAVNYPDQTIISGGINHILSTQITDGGWGFRLGDDSEVYYTALALQTLSQFKPTYDLKTPIANGVTYLLTHQNADGGFGSPASTGYETALAVIALISSGVSDQQSAISIQHGLDYLSATQLPNGSWNDDPYSTALALRALAMVKPNLSISSSDITFSNPAPRTGDTITITANIQNTGPAQADNVVIQIYDGDPASGGVFIGETTIASIPAFGSSPAFITWTIPSAAARSIFVTVDSLNTIDELSETDNIASQNLTSATLPDLSIISADISLFPPPVLSYIMIAVLGTIRNLGETDASNMVVDFYMETAGQAPVRLAGSGGIYSVPAGGSTEIMGVIADYQATPGPKTIHIYVDPQNSILETNKANNHAVKSILIDAEIDLYTNASSITFSPANPKEGDIVTITSAVRNAGNGNTKNVVVRHYLGDPAKGGTRIGNDITIPVLGSYGSQTVTTQWDSTGHVGRNNIYVVVDPDDVIDEINNWNNIAGKTIKVASTQGPDLIVNQSDIVIAPMNAISGDDITIATTIRNVGTNDAISVPIDIRITDVNTGERMFTSAQAIASLVTGGSTTVQTIWNTTGISGFYKIEIAVDAEDAVAELNETNNTASTMIAVTAVQGPDIVIETIDRSGVISNPQTRTFSGNVVATIRNIGNLNTEMPFVITAFEDLNGNRIYDAGTDVLLGQTTYQAALAAGASGNVTMPISGNVLFIDSPLYLFVDSTNVITELDETNNVTCLGVFTLCRNSKVDAAVKSGASWLIDHQLNVDAQGTMKAWAGFNIYNNALAVKAYKSNGKTAGTKYANVLDKLISMQAPDGSWDEAIGTTAEAIRSLLYIGADPQSSVITNAVAWLTRVQSADGSWGGTAASTGRVLIALIKAGVSKNEPYIQKAVQWLTDNRNSDGYWGDYPGIYSNRAVTTDCVIGLALATSPTDSRVLKAKNWYYPYRNDYVYTRTFWVKMMLEIEPDNNEITTVASGLPNLQMSNGGWTWTPSYSTADLFMTIEVLDVLGRLGFTGTKINNGIVWIENHINSFWIGFPEGKPSTTTDVALDALQAADIGDAVNLNAIAAGRKAIIASQTSDGLFTIVIPNIGLTEPYLAENGYAMFMLKDYKNVSAAEQSAVNKNINSITSLQLADGGWATWKYYYTSDLTTSQIILKGLLRSGLTTSNAVISKGLAYLNSKQNADGGFGSTYLTAQAAIIYRLAGSSYQTRLNQTIAWLKANQNPDGGWGTTLGYTSSTGSTSFALMALSYAGESGPEIAKGASWLLAAQNADHGWGALMGIPVSYDSTTAYAIWALSLVKYNLAFNLDLSTERQSYCPGDTVRISATPDAPAAEITVTGALKLQEGTTAQPTFSLSDNTFSAEYVLPSTALPGTATLQATGIATYGYSIATTSFVVKNCASLKPDLSIGLASLQETADPLAPNTRIVTATVRNLGNIDAHDVTVTFYKDAPLPENLIGSSVISSISAYSSTETTSTTVSIIGDTVIHVVVDPANAIDELNEANNIASLSLSMVLPDLSISAADLTATAPDPLNIDVRSVFATIRNLGGIGADNVTVQFYKDAVIPENLIESVNIPNISALTGVATVNTTLTLTGDATVYVFVDPSNAVIETDESNNMASIALTRMIPDLSASSSDISIIPPAVTEGQSTVIAAIIHNTGNMGASDVVVSFYDGDPEAGGILIGSITKSWIDAGSTAYAETAWNTFGQSGLNYIHVKVDPLNLIHEGNETNNSSLIPVDVTLPVKPDLAITGTDIAFSSLNPSEGDLLTLTATIRNLGIDAANVGVALYDGDPAAGGRLIDMKTIYQFIPFGSSTAVTFNIQTIGMAGNHKYYIVLDPEHMIDEINETNNVAWNSVTIGASGLGLSITTDKAAYTANEDIQVTLNVSNQRDAIRSGTIEVKLLDSAGTVVSEATASQALTFGPLETQTLSFTLNTGSILAGDYRVFSQFIESDNTASKIDTPITVAAGREVSSSVTTNRIVYFPNQQAVITASITSLSQNYIFENLAATVSIVDAGAQVIYTDTQPISILLPGQLAELKTYWNTATYPAGAYPVTLEVRDSSGVLVSSGSATLTITDEIKPSRLLRGQISVDRQSILQGEPLTISYQVTNVGNIDISQANLSIKTVHVVNLSVYDTLTDQAAVLMGASYSNAQQLGTNTYSAKDYLVILSASINGIEETLASTYFRVEGAPSEPSLNAPLHGSDVETITPILSVNNATDPNDDRLTYEFQVYADQGLTTLVAESLSIEEGSSITSWQIPATLQENSWYFWRARAYDSRLYGQWMDPAAFRVNVTNEPPTAPTLSAPANDAFVDTSLPVLTVNNASDPDSVNLTYNFVVAIDPDFVTIIDQQIGIFSGTGSTSWQITVPLLENTWYYWKAEADDWLITGPWMTTAQFFVNTANEAPTAPVIIDPVDNSETASRDVVITVSNSTDPDSAAITYQFEMDSSLTFDSPDRVISGSVPQGQNSTSWTASGLKDNTYYYARVKTSDGSAESALSAVVGFFVNTANDAPTAPVLSNPSNNSGVNSFSPLLSVHNAMDIDGDLLTYDFEVYQNPDLSGLVATVSGVTETLPLTGWTVSTSLMENSTYFWRARAFDGDLYSPWMALSSFTVNTANDAPSAPSLYFPTQGSSLSTLTPTLSINNATDPDSDTLTYDFEVYAGTTPVTSMTSVPQNTSGITSVVLSDLSDNTTYTWRARAYDGDRYGAWMDMATFSIHMPSTNITATIEVEPETLNRKSQGNWVTVEIELPRGYRAQDVDISSILLEGVVHAEPWPHRVGCSHDRDGKHHDKDSDHRDGDEYHGERELMVKFRRSEVLNLLPDGNRVPVHVTGRVGAVSFEGVDYIRVIH